MKTNAARELQKAKTMYMSAKLVYFWLFLCVSQARVDI